ncbi:MAG: LacI family transcriptional regulator [Verrucomicrobia bacterium]|nr:MAG: LacI family transcriptional regulator [Verrucomicrobiota bacterium]
MIQAGFAPGEGGRETKTLAFSNTCWYFRGVPEKKSSAPIVSTSALARHLGLSRWTISRVLNGHPEVKPETTRRVLAAMKELGFVPNPHGRALRGARTGIVGVCFQAIGSPIVARKIAVLQRVLRKAGQRALFEVTDGNPRLELEVVRNFVAMKVDSLVLVGGLTQENGPAIEAMLAQRSIPTVLVDPMNESSLPSVALNRGNGIAMAIRHLLDLGHRRFALFGIDERVAYGRNRWVGIREVAEERGLAIDETFVTLSEENPPALDFGYGRRLAERFVAFPERPTAVLALNDQVAVGAMAFLQERGIPVPGEVSLVGFDNLDVAAHVNPRLTTIDQDVDLLMQHAVDLLEGQSDADAPRHVLVEPIFVPGRTTGPAPA